MKEINLFVDFEFTSLSPDAQPISVGIVSEEYFNEQYRQLYTDKVEIKKGNCSIDHLTTKSFYAEFSDFDINRCDDWVKENVVGKLKFDQKKMTSAEINGFRSGNYSFKEDTKFIKLHLKEWLKQFSDYQIQFVVDCGTWDWYHLIQLLDEREHLPCQLIIDEAKIPNDTTLEELIKAFQKQPLMIMKSLPESQVISWYQSGLPILPSNISPVPFELNQFIAHKKGISVREAFDLNREELACDAENSMMKEKKIKEYRYFSGKEWSEDNQKHNALWDAKVMKEIYEKLSV